MYQDERGRKWPESRWEGYVIALRWIAGFARRHPVAFVLFLTALLIPGMADAKHRAMVQLVGGGLAVVLVIATRLLSRPSDAEREAGRRLSAAMRRRHTMKRRRRSRR